MAAPKGKHMFGVVKVGERGQIVIPKRARDIFQIQPGDSLLVLGDEEQGLALVKNEVFLAMAERIFSSASPSEAEREFADEVRRAQEEKTDTGSGAGRAEQAVWQPDCSGSSVHDGKTRGNSGASWPKRRGKDHNCPDAQRAYPPLRRGTPFWRDTASAGKPDRRNACSTFRLRKRLWHADCLFVKTWN